MDTLGIIYDLLNQLFNYLANVPVLAIIGALAGLVGFVITQRKKIKEIWDERGEYLDNRMFKKINSALARSIEECKKEPILDLYTKITLPKLVVRRGLKTIKIDLNPGGILEAKIPSKSMENAVKALSLYISRNLGNYSVVRDQKILLKALEAFLLKSIVENSGINNSFEVAAKGYLNRVTSNKDIEPIFRIITKLNYEMKGKNIYYKDRRLLRILVIESIRGGLGEN